MNLQSLTCPGRAALALLFVASLAPRAHCQAGASTLGGPGPLLRQADSNNDGRVEAEEWQALLAGLAADREGKLDTIALKGQLLPLDFDGDGKRTVADVEALFAKLDKDANGILAADEARPGARAPAAELMLAVLALPAADSDADGAISAAERERFVSGLKASDEGRIRPEQAAAWVRAVVATSGSVRANFSPAVLIAQIDAELDADGDGRLTKDDLQAMFRQADADGDGALSATELAPRRTRAPGGPGAGDEPQWYVSPAQRSRPPLMPWQRNLEDALALSKSSGKPLLLCVNMDNEDASNFAAYSRYNDPEFVALASGFIPVVASPDTHSLSPRDDRGRRLADPRLGRVLCSEHIAIEPLLFERYFGGERFAPRHVGVATDGTILFDIKLVQSFEGLERALRTHGKAAAGAAGGGEADLRQLDDAALLASHDARLRDELERRFLEVDVVRRVLIAEQAFSAERSAQHPEIVVLALRDPDSSVRMQGLRAMIRFPALMDLERVPEAMAVAAADPDLEREMVSALENAAQSEDATRRARAGKLHSACTAIAQPSRLIDPKLWIPLFAVAAAEQGPGDVEALNAALVALGEQVSARPTDAGLRVHLASGWLRLAEAYIAAGNSAAGFALQDAETAAEEALALSADDPRALGVAARAKYLLADMEGAASCAERALPGLLGEAGSPLSRAVLESFVQARTRQLYEAMGQGAFPPEWASDVLAGHAVLLANPAAPEARWVAFLQLLEALEARRPLALAVRMALDKHPASADLHSWLRFQVLRDEGAAAMDGTYQGAALSALRAADSAANDWFHGRAMLDAAEHGVRTRSASAGASYARCAELFARSAAEAPHYAASAGHYRALALAGLARLEAASDRTAQAVEHLVEALGAGAEVAQTLDGLGTSPLQSARELHRRLAQENDAGAAPLKAAIDALGVD